MARRSRKSRSTGTLAASASGVSSPMKCTYKLAESDSISEIRTVEGLIEALKLFPKDMRIILEIGDEICIQVLSPKMGICTPTYGEPFSAVII